MTVLATSLFVTIAEGMIVGRAAVATAGPATLRSSALSVGAPLVDALGSRMSVFAAVASAGVLVESLSLAESSI